ncbi:carbohydrate ABC transporter permease [Reyranella sp. CPCC 100927]|uniref:carbohydrate ABC transporter permease n=1 Tax=Reyranella sp. CPCC 100927 TaxID=2599616 RepID=UPI0011B4FB66|nr:sugar ABC transporter permease [Reyranella sp. CPCC 100927]TWT13572.1 sugar ABC transporter permease [Reyranella sp. CPCC 100927]
MTLAAPKMAIDRPAKRRRSSREMSAGWFAFFMNVPTLLFLGLVLAWPVLYAGYLSVHRVGLAQLRRGEFPFNGWENYGRVLEDPLFWTALQNTAVFTAITVSTEVVLAVMIALLINQSSIWTSRITRLLILLPYAIPPIANGLIWSFMYSFQFGFLNRILFTLGLISDPVNWAGNPDTALYAVTVPYIWRTLPFAIILVHAALQGVPRELYEQAAVDGAHAWRRFWHITLPLLRPVIAVILILRTAFAFAVFEEILAITQGGPGDATWVAAWYSYKITFSPPNNFGMGSASAFILALMIGVMALIYLRTIYRRVTL